MTIFFENHTPNLSKVIYGLLIIIIIERILAFQRSCRIVNYLPGIRSPFSPLSLVGVIIGATSGTTWYQSGLDVVWIRKRRLYKTHETISVVPWFYGAPMIFTSSIDVMKQIVSTSSGKALFVKSPETTTGAALYGDNLLTTEGSQWRKHRRLMGPAFDNSLYQLVWEKGLKTYRDMVSAEGWSEKKTVDVPVTQIVIFKYALIVLGLCAFGFDFSWTEPPETPGGEMTVQEAMRTVIDNFLHLLFTPPFIQRFSSRLKRLRKAYDQLGQFMKDQVQVRREEIRGHTIGEYNRRDAFSTLVQANESEDGKNKLEDSDLIGNVFVMLFAGHETTANTLAATLALLSVHQDVQDEVVKQIVDVVGYQRDPAIEDYNNLNKVLAAFYEALRLFPAAQIMIRETGEDSVIQIPNPRGQEGTQPCPIRKGTWMIIDLVGTHLNPRYFEEPEEYKPSRWHGVPNDLEQFAAFGFGSRACIGKKFAATEAVCFLTMFLRDWKVEPLLREGETVDGWKERILDANIGFALAMKNAPLRLTRREPLIRN